jgi:hypothetical protein
MVLAGVGVGAWGVSDLVQGARAGVVEVAAAAMLVVFGGVDVGRVEAKQARRYALVIGGLFVFAGLAFLGVVPTMSHSSPFPRLIVAVAGLVCCGFGVFVLLQARRFPRR